MKKEEKRRGQERRRSRRMSRRRRRRRREAVSNTRPGQTETNGTQVEVADEDQDGG